MGEKVARERQELTLSGKLDYLGKAVRLRLKKATIGLRHSFNLELQARKSLEVELERKKLLDKAKDERLISELTKMRTDRGEDGERKN